MCVCVYITLTWFISCWSTGNKLSHSSGLFTKWTVIFLRLRNSTLFFRTFCWHNQASSAKPKLKNKIVNKQIQTFLKWCTLYLCTVTSQWTVSHSGQQIFSFTNEINIWFSFLTDWQEKKEICMIFCCFNTSAVSMHALSAVLFPSTSLTELEWDPCILFGHHWGVCQANYSSYNLSPPPKENFNLKLYITCKFMKNWCFLKEILVPKL